MTVAMMARALNWSPERVGALRMHEVAGYADALVRAHNGIGSGGFEVEGGRPDDDDQVPDDVKAVWAELGVVPAGHEEE